MLAIAYYVLKVIICSGILFGYYRLALHNKVFHRWNRFYLLSAVIISLLIPIIKINILHDPSQDTSQVIKLLNVVTTGDEIIIEANAGSKHVISNEVLIIGLYTIVSLVLLYILLRTLYSLSKLIKNSASQFIYGVRLVNTDTKGTPFSFFSNIFWNSKLDIDSATGEKIFKHELAHVQEKHSADKLFINIVMIFFWCNPFFWLIRREMNMIHEFIADSKAVEDNDTSTLAAMIIQAAYPQHSFGLTSSFFSSSIKRRILMLTKMQNPGVHYISRVLVLPLLTIVFVAFTIKTKRIKPAEELVANITLEKNITVVIDAGHGGEEPGAKALDGTWEKDLTLAIAKKVKALNINPSIKILLTRENDVYQNIRDKVDWTVKQKPDAFISIHINANPEKNRSGFEINIGKEQGKYESGTRILGSILSSEINNTYTVFPELLQGNVNINRKGVWVLDAPQINYPALLIHCGYLTNEKDLAFIQNTANQEKIARNILNAIARYAKAREENAITQTSSGDSQPPYFAKSKSKENIFNTIAVDTVQPKIKSIDFTIDDRIIVIYNDNRAVKMTRKEAINKGIINNDFSVSTQASQLMKSGRIIYVLNGEETSKEKLDKVDPTDIATINMIESKDKKANILYVVTKNGELKYKDRTTIQEVELDELRIIALSPKRKDKVEINEVALSEDDMIHEGVEKEATFPGGNGEWTKYISREINRYIDTLQRAGKTGTCVAQFIVGRDGTISNVEALTLEGTKFSEVIVDAIANGPKWNPAMQNGKKVRAYRKQPVTFQISDN
ncbi:MAG: N-acetylmuramoyl-L-alanine amidase [Agriterribacter sp.]